MSVQSQPLGCAECGGLAAGLVWVPRAQALGEEEETECFPTIG